MRPPQGRLRIALLSYRGHPHVGGQGIYVRYLSHALTELGHHVEVFSGQPYPDLDDDVKLTRIPSLDLYRDEDPFRRPAPSEFRGPVDVLEFGLMCTAAFPEPLTFSLRAARVLGGRSGEFDIVHDNQCLGYGLLTLRRRLPVVATVHHPIPIDRRHDLSGARSPVRRATLWRWYSFVRMQRRVVRRLPALLTVSESARSDVVREFRVPPERIRVVHNGVDPDLFRPLPDVARVPGRVITLASSDAPMKGLPVLIEAMAKLRTEVDAELVVVGKGDTPAARAAARRFGIDDGIRFVGRVDDLQLVEHLATARTAVVPSLYEGFSLPAVEAMACGLPLVATSGSALPEVAGRDGDAVLLVEPGDAGALAADLKLVLTETQLRG
ncbi:MAG: glycosyltransferase family 4 protein, partial [Actinomycetota bacterium]